MIDLSKLEGFDWDTGNIEKNLLKHQVTGKEAEQVFISEPMYIFKDEEHSLLEIRYMVWGTTNKNRKLSVFFTIRRNKVRVVSARDMHKKERREYENKIQKTTKV